MTIEDVLEAPQEENAEEATDEEGSTETQKKNSSASVPRIPFGAELEIDLIREQLENFGRVIIVRNAGVFVPDRSVSLMTRALRVPRVPRSNGPTHFTIPRHIDKAGQLLESTENWDPINWRTRGAKPKGAQAILLAKPVLRHLPEEGAVTWDQVEELLRKHGVNGVYEPLAVCILPQNEAKATRADLYTLETSSGSKSRSKLVDTVASVFRRGEPGRGEITRDVPALTDEAKTKWNEKLTQMGLTNSYIICSPFGLPTESIHDWAVERCAEVLRHALEWRKVQTIVLCQNNDRGKAERLRIISGSNVSFIVCDLPQDEINVAISQARAVIATPGPVITAALQLGIGTVCITGPSKTSVPLPTENSTPHYVIRAQGADSEKMSQYFNLEEHGCLEGLEAGPVARALSKVLVTAPTTDASH